MSVIQMLMVIRSPRYSTGMTSIVLCALTLTTTHVMIVQYKAALISPTMDQMMTVMELATKASNARSV